MSALTFARIAADLAAADITYAAAQKALESAQRALEAAAARVAMMAELANERAPEAWLNEGAGDPRRIVVGKPARGFGGCCYEAVAVADGRLELREITGFDWSTDGATALWRTTHVNLSTGVEVDYEGMAPLFTPEQLALLVAAVGGAP